jgi:tRNA (guanine37-N1)-methyltransferase
MPAGFVTNYKNRDTVFSSQFFSMTTFHIITLFPQALDSYLSESILKRAREDKKIRFKFYNPRDFIIKKRGQKELTYSDRRVDDKPYGGGPGMVIEALPVIKAITKAKGNKKKVKIIFFTPQGEQFTTDYAKKVAAKYDDIILVCGRYEGIDARVKKVFNVDEISVGPYVLTGGELPAMILIDCISRQIEGVLGDINSLEESRTASNEVYTRPSVITYKGKKYKVPEVLLGGNHKLIEEWRKATQTKGAR